MLPCSPRVADMVQVGTNWLTCTATLDDEWGSRGEFDTLQWRCALEAARLSLRCLAAAGTGYLRLAAVFGFHDQHLRISVSSVLRVQHGLVTAVVPGHGVHVEGGCWLLGKVKPVLRLDTASYMALGCLLAGHPECF